MILEFQNVTYKIPSGELIYKNLNLKVYKNEYYGILGQNGAGKSTLIEMIMGTRKLSAGRIDIFGEKADDSYRKQKHRIFVVSHDFAVPGHIASRDLWAYYKFFYPNYSIELQERLARIFQIDEKKKFGSLSTGQKVKSLLVAAFAAKAELYLFDEVTAVLDPKSRRRFFEFLKEFKTLNDCSVFMATNIAEDIQTCMDKVLFIDDNREVKIKDAQDIESLFYEDDSEAIA